MRSGRSVSLAVPINTVVGPDNPRLVFHCMIQTYDRPSNSSEPQYAMDYLASYVHTPCHTHIDALSHVAYKGRLYNAKPTGIVTSRGSTTMDVTAYAHGVVGRGVLLDIPRLRGVKWIEPGEAVTGQDLQAAERSQNVRLMEGNIFLFRTGHHLRRLELKPGNREYDGEGKTGLDPNAMLMLHERKIAAFLPESDGETVPSNVDGVAEPVHAIQICAMGMAVFDNLQFEELVKVCEEEHRWEFMVVAVPLRLPGGTDSLINPIAIF